MIVRLLAIVALLTAAVPPAGSAKTDWTRVAVHTAEGGFRIGNPKARVRFVEIANYTCPHCAHFSQGGGAFLERNIRHGLLAVEYRPLANSSLGLAATVTARCAAPDAFLAVNDALYAQQNRWYGQAEAYAQANAARLELYPELDQLRLIAQRGGIGDVAAAAGLPSARLAACFADRRVLDDALKAIDAASRIADATPTFLFNGKKVAGMTWDQMAAQLATAGLK